MGYRHTIKHGSVFWHLGHIEGMLVPLLLLFFLYHPMQRSISPCFDASARRRHRELWVTSRHPRNLLRSRGGWRDEKPAILRFNTLTLGETRAIIERVSRLTHTLLMTAAIYVQRIYFSTRVHIRATELRSKFLARKKKVCFYMNILNI